MEKIYQFLIGVGFVFLAMWFILKMMLKDWFDRPKLNKKEIDNIKSLVQINTNKISLINQEHGQTMEKLSELKIDNKENFHRLEEQFKKSFDEMKGYISEKEHKLEGRDRALIDIIEVQTKQNENLFKAIEDFKKNGEVQ